MVWQRAKLNHCYNNQIYFKINTNLVVSICSVSQCFLFTWNISWPWVLYFWAQRAHLYFFWFIFCTFQWGRFWSGKFNSLISEEFGLLGQVFTGLPLVPPSGPGSGYWTISWWWWNKEPSSHSSHRWLLCKLLKVWMLLTWEGRILILEGAFGSKKL